MISTSPSSTRRILTTIAALLAVILIASGCGDDGGTTSDATDSTSSTASAQADTALSADETALTAAIDDLVIACQAQDHSHLRDLSHDRLHDQLGDEHHLFNQVEHLRLVNHHINIDGDTATAAVNLDVTIDGTTTHVDRTWHYEKTDGHWLLAEVPDCLFS